MVNIFDQESSRARISFAHLEEGAPLHGLEVLQGERNLQVAADYDRAILDSESHRKTIADSWGMSGAPGASMTIGQQVKQRSLYIFLSLYIHIYLYVC